MSGGVDSCVLFRLLLAAKIPFAVAHVNFQLRGNDSDEDQEWVEKLCSDKGIKCFVKKMDVKAFKQENNDSTQSAARKLRYFWFDELMTQHDFSYLLTAHHLNDSIESFFINLMRGTGLKGLLGIRNQEKIIRPLLSFSKDEIVNYAQQNQIKWREDVSNASTDYLRNKIRHKILPELEGIAPHFLSQSQRTLSLLEGTYHILEQHIAQLKRELFNYEKENITINIEQIQHLSPTEDYVFYLFQEFGFRHPTEIIKLMSAQNSAEIQSEKYRLIKNRTQFIIKKLNNENSLSLSIPQADFKLVEMKWELEKSRCKNPKTIISFDLKLIKFPLHLRLRKEGDVFFPSGMGGKSKKLSKYFKDNKFSKIEKENCQILCDAQDRILWVVGHRADERFLPTDKTTQWLHIKNLD